jgi:hypothetical protein
MTDEPLIIGSELPPARRRFQFSLRYLMIAMVFIGLLLMIRSSNVQTQSIVSRKNMEAISIALERYQADFKSYPPEHYRRTGSAESLAHYLCEQLSKDTKNYSPYMALHPDRLKDSDGDGQMELLNLWDSRYLYKLTHDGSPLVIDPGKDGLLGGIFSKETGFVPDESDANGDGVADDRDNIYSSPVPVRGGL